MIHIPNKKRGGKSLGSLSLWTLLLVAFSIMLLAGVLVLLVGLNVFAYPRGIPTPVTPSPVAPPPSIELSPAEGAPSTVIAVAGAGWLPEDTVLVHADALWSEDSQEGETPLASATVAEDGRFVASFTIPSDLNWETLPQRVLVTARSPATGHEAFAVLGILATGPTPSPEPTATPQPTARPEPSATPGCVDRVSFVNDVTIPDYTRLSPGQSFVKTWRLRNSGSCAWTTDYALVFAGGHRMGGPLAVPLRGLVAPGGTVDLSVTLTAPAGNGTYEGKWQLRNAEGDLFGTGSSAKGVFWVRIVVGPMPTPTPALTQWRGEYYSNPNLTGAPVLVRNDAAVDFNWRYSAPTTGLAVDGFSARWTRSLAFEEGLYRFHVVVDDGVRLYVDDALVIDAWYDGARREVTADRRLSGGYHNLRVEYYERTGEALIHLWWEKLASYPDWRGEYWSNRSLDGKPVLVRNDVSVDFNWALGAPAAGVPADNFSARWTRTAHFDAATYRFHVLVDDGARLWVDDQLVIDAWLDGAAREVRANHALASGTHSLRVEFYEHTGHAQIRLWWEKVSSPSYPDWKGEYWSNRNFSGGPALVRNDAAIDFRWGAGAVAAALPADNFSARWSRQVTFEPGVYRFYAWADDGIRVYVDSDLVLNEWHDSAGDEVYMVDLPLRDRHQLVVEYYERGGQALVKLWWKRVGAWPTPTPTPVPPTPVPNRPPVAMADSATTSEDSPVDIDVLANDHDPDGDALTVTTYSSPSTKGGTVSCTSAGMCTYDPPASFSGTDTFAYTVSDGKGGIAIATVTVTVNPANGPPVAVDDSVTTRRNTGVDFNVLANDSDPDGDTLTVSDYDRSSAKGGTVDCTASGVCTYVPPVNFIGSDTFIYTVSDGKGGSDTGTVTVLVYPANSPPVAADDLATTGEDTPVEVNVLDNDSDPDGDTLTVTGYDASSAKGGAVSCTNSGVCTYTPPANFEGSDTFTYTVSDGNGGSDTATVTVSVTAANDAPVAVDDHASTDNLTPVNINVLANDSDPDRDTLTVTDYQRSSTRGGTVNCTNSGACTYTPRDDFTGNGTDTFTYTVSDGNGGNDTATVTISVTANPTPKPPTPIPASVRFNEVLPAPAAVDWNGDSVTDEQDEWIELYNAGTTAVDLSGWLLDSGVTSTVAYTIPEGTVLRPGGFMVFYRDKSGIVLGDQGGKVRLLEPDGTVVDVVTFEELAVDASYSRDSDGSWHSNWPPSPGEPNQPPAATSLLRWTGTLLHGLAGSSGDLHDPGYRR